MKEAIRKILLETLISNYDLGNIENGGISGGEEAIEKLHGLFTDSPKQLKLRFPDLSNDSSVMNTFRDDD